jgi:hypothetical protein
MTPIPGADYKSIDEALAAFQMEMPTLIKNKDGQVGNQKTKYADMEQVNEVVLTKLSALGVIYVCMPTLDDDGKFVLSYELKHVPSDTKKAGRWPLKLSENSQQMGSATTYGRRYVLLCLTGVATEDDDGASASGQPPAVQRRARPARAEAPADGQTVQRTQRVSDAPPLPGEDVDPDAVTRPQTTKLAMQFGDLEVTDRNHRLALMTDMMGRPITSINDLTKREASAAIDAIDKALKTDQPLTAMIEIYRRTQGEPAAARPTGRSRNARDAVTNGGDEGAEPAPWETEEPR